MDPKTDQPSCYEVRVLEDWSADYRSRWERLVERLLAFIDTVALSSGGPSLGDKPVPRRRVVIVNQNTGAEVVGGEWTYLDKTIAQDQERFGALLRQPPANVEAELARLEHLRDW